jgi:two-component system, cell cycle response regulator DivK
MDGSPEAERPGQVRAIASKAWRQPEPRRAPRRRPLILIVDDSADTREVYTEYLRHRGLDVITAVDGAAGIELATRTKPNVIILDLAMPRMSGVSAAHHLKHDPRTRKIPIIMLTGYALRAIQEGALEMGVDVFLTKPCLPEDLEGHITALLRGRSSQRNDKPA